jgi:hypothetical protein
MWRKVFDFNPTPTLTPRLVPSAHEGLVLRDRTELIDFLKQHGVRLDDPQHQLRIEQVSDTIYQNLGYAGQGELFIVVQWSVVGWIRDDYKGA